MSDERQDTGKADNALLLSAMRALDEDNMRELEAERYSQRSTLKE